MRPADLLCLVLLLSGCESALAQKEPEPHGHCWHASPPPVMSTLEVVPPVVAEWSEVCCMCGELVTHKVALPKHGPYTGGQFIDLASPDGGTDAR